MYIVQMCIIYSGLTVKREITELSSPDLLHASPIGVTPGPEPAPPPAPAPRCHSVSVGSGGYQESEPDTDRCQQRHERQCCQGRGHIVTSVPIVLMDISENWKGRMCEDVLGSSTKKSRKEIRVYLMFGFNWKQHEKGWVRVFTKLERATMCCRLMWNKDAHILLF